ncbi:hypothetical protein MKW98_032254 [Papaver atlanticum]|uniref:Uncharacterized protein n=1 Tax=Papaver atlanticum TaxID=357466 RepID=A0AAD4XCL1_9MAGN|nr:hypothetical protein MKW98_032254 [Papaver atlanticum]
MDGSANIGSGVCRSKNTARKSVGRTVKPAMDIDPTTPEQTRVYRMKREGVILEKRNKKICRFFESTDAGVLKRKRSLEESVLGFQSGSMNTFERSTDSVMGSLNSHGGSDIGDHLEIEVIEHSTKLVQYMQLLDQNTYAEVTDIL